MKDSNGQMTHKKKVAMLNVQAKNPVRRLGFFLHTQYGDISTPKSR